MKSVIRSYELPEQPGVFSLVLPSNFRGAQSEILSVNVRDTVKAGIRKTAAFLLVLESIEGSDAHPAIRKFLLVATDEYFCQGCYDEDSGCMVTYSQYFASYMLGDREFHLFMPCY